MKKVPLDARAATARARSPCRLALGPRPAAARRGPTRSPAARPLGGENIISDVFDSLGSIRTKVTLWLCKVRSREQQCRRAQGLAAMVFHCARCANAMASLTKTGRQQDFLVNMT